MQGNKEGKRFRGCSQLLTSGLCKCSCPSPALWAGWSRACHPRTPRLKRRILACLHQMTFWFMVIFLLCLSEKLSNPHLKAIQRGKLLCHVWEPVVPVRSWKWVKNCHTCPKPLKILQHLSISMDAFSTQHLLALSLVTVIKTGKTLQNDRKCSSHEDLHMTREKVQVALRSPWSLLFSQTKQPQLSPVSHLRSQSLPVRGRVMGCPRVSVCQQGMAQRFPPALCFHLFPAVPCTHHCSHLVLGQPCPPQGAVTVPTWSCSSCCSRVKV